MNELVADQQIKVERKLAEGLWLFERAGTYFKLTEDEILSLWKIVQEWESSNE